MNLEKFTERSRGFLQAAQTIAVRESHQRLSPEHLLKALLDDEQGLAANLITRAGGDAARVAERLCRVVGGLERKSRRLSPVERRVVALAPSRVWLATMPIRLNMETLF